MLSIIKTSLIIKRFTQNIEQSSKCFLTDRNHNTGTCSSNLHITMKAFTCAEHDTSYNAVTDMLRNLHNKFPVTIHNIERILDGRKISLFKFYIHHRS